MPEKKNGKGRDRISHILYLIYLIMLVVGLGLAIKFFYIQVFWKPDEKIATRLTQPVKKKDLEPVRGCILAEDGRPLAMSYPRYQVYIDCNARRKEFNNMDPDARVDSIRAWKDKASVFAEGLALIYKNHGASYYRKLLWDNFENGNRYLKLGTPIELEELRRLKEYPLFNEGRYKGGVWAEPIPTRRYPYGSLARRTIGNVVENENNSYYTGIDGKYNHILHGENGKFYIKQTDNGFIRDYDSCYVKAIDGNDIRTTLNIDYQDIADRLLRKYVEPETDLEATCFVLMEVETGAIKAIVNLERDGKGNLLEKNNLAALRLGEPGSVFKITTLMTCIEDGYVTSIDQTIPCNGGKITFPGYKYETDKHLKDYERVFHTSQVPIWYCVQVSSNNCFRYLAINYYEDNPQAFTGRLHQYNLGKAFDFDIAETIPKPTIREPQDKDWTKTDLGQVSMGYGVMVTPLHLLAYYNAIANKGKMMKPYLVEDIEKNGKVIQKLGPSVLNSNICKPQTAEMITEALCKVTEMGTEAGRGTAWRLANTKVKVAGKTGTAYHVVNGRYRQPDGSAKQQGTFVGFFPAENPKYTAICVVYSDLTKKEYAGGVIPASTVRDFVNEIYNIDPLWNETINSR